MIISEYYRISFWYLHSKIRFKKDGWKTKWSNLQHSYRMDECIHPYIHTVFYTPCINGHFITVSKYLVSKMLEGSRSCWFFLTFCRFTARFRWEYLVRFEWCGRRRSIQVVRRLTGTLKNIISCAISYRIRYKGTEWVLFVLYRDTLGNLHWGILLVF